MMRVVAIILLCFLCIVPKALYSEAFQLNGGVEKQEIFKMNTVSDKASGYAVENAQISIPSNDFVTQSDESGKFEMPKNISPPYILSVKKAGYQPFSLTVRSYGKVPLKIEISKNSSNKIIISEDSFHLGDNSFSSSSANAGDFKMKSVGIFYQKDFFIKKLNLGEDVNLVLGSIIGVDTREAKGLGQTNLINAYSSPVEIFFNSKKIADIKVNGDNQKIVIPKNLIKQNAENTVKIASGINMTQFLYTDYDDFEFTNLFLEYK
ncbi:MAG: hypothetical protein WCF95_00755 [bacterium]